MAAVQLAAVGTAADTAAMDPALLLIQSKSSGARRRASQATDACGKALARFAERLYKRGKMLAIVDLPDPSENDHLAQEQDSAEAGGRKKTTVWVDVELKRARLVTHAARSEAAARRGEHPVHGNGTRAAEQGPEREQDPPDPPARGPAQHHRQGHQPVPGAAAPRHLATAVHGRRGKPRHANRLLQSAHPGFLRHRGTVAAVDP